MLGTYCWEAQEAKEVQNRRQVSTVPMEVQYWVCIRLVEEIIG